MTISPEIRESVEFGAMDWVRLILGSPGEAIRMHLEDEAPDPDLDAWSVKLSYWLFAPIAFAVQFVGVVLMVLIGLAAGMGGALWGAATGAVRGWRRATGSLEGDDRDAS